MESEDKLNREKLVISDLCLEYLFIKSIINYDQYVDIHNRIKKFQEDNHVIVNFNQLFTIEIFINFNHFIHNFYIKWTSAFTVTTLAAVSCISR